MTRIELRPMGNGWCVLARALCDCGLSQHGITVRAVYGLTVAAAVWKFRFARREAQIVEEALR